MSQSLKFMCYHIAKITLNGPSPISLDWQDFIMQFSDQKGSYFTLTDQGKPIGEASLTPYNLWHLSFDESFPLDQIDQICQAINATTLSIKSPTKANWEILKQKGFYLHTEFVRWFSPTPDLDTPDQFLDKQRAKHLRYNLRKAERHAYYEIEEVNQQNLAEWIPIFLKQNDHIPGRFVPFTIGKLQSGEWQNGFLMVKAKDINSHQLLGGGIINSWGLFSQIGQNKLFTAFTLRAFQSSERQNALGYLFYLGLIKAAHQQKSPIICHGGDFAFWGTEVNPGLFGYKTGLGMYPFPEAKVEAFKLLIPENIQKYSSQFGHYIIEISDTSPLAQTYFEKRSSGWDGMINELYKIPSAHLNDYQQMMANWQMHHFSTQPNQIPMPPGLKLIEHLN